MKCTTTRGRSHALLARLAVATILAVFANTVIAAQLTGSSKPADSSYDLTANSADWTHFGYVPLPIDRKRGVTPQITDYSSIAAADPGSTDKVETTYSWNDGLSPVQSIAGTSTGKRVFRPGKGFRFTVPARKRMRTLRVYVGAWSARGSLTASLSDGSAPDFVASIENRSRYLGRVVTINFRAATDLATLQVDYVVAQNYPNQSYITLESAALNASGASGPPSLSGSTANSPALVNLSALGPTDWVHWGRISDQPVDRKSGVAQKIGSLAAVGVDVSPTPAEAASTARWSDGAPNGVVAGTNSSVRIFDRAKGLKVTVAADTTPRTVKAWVGIKGRAQGQFRAVLSDGSRPAWNQTLRRQGSGQSSYEFTINFAAASANQTLTLSWVRTDDRVSASYLGFESVKLLGRPEPDPDPEPDPGTGPGPGPGPDPKAGTGVIGDLVFADTNGDGLQSAGETGIAGVTVALRQCTGSTNLATTVTDGNGSYRFANLVDGERYRVVVVAPANYEFSPRRVGSNRGKDSDAFANGTMGCVRAKDGKNKVQFDAGLVANGPVVDPIDPGDGSVGGGVGRIGDRVWDDRNNNGIQDPGEPGVAGVSVELFACAGESAIATVSTSPKGLYKFTEVPAARYKLRFVLPPGRTFSALKQGNSILLDSDAKPDGFTRCLQIRSSAARFGNDAGLN